MEQKEIQEKKPSALGIFLDEVQKSPLTLTFLAILTGIILGGLLAAITSLEMYAAFKVSFWEGIKTGLNIAWSTYSALFTGSVGNFGDMSDALASGDALAIRHDQT